MKKIKVALVQNSYSENPEENISKNIKAIEKSKENNVDFVILSELCNNHYFCISENPENFKYAETIPGPTTDLYTNLAKRHEIVILTSIFEKKAKGLYFNTCIIIDKDGKICGLYRKMHIPDDPLFYEKFYFTPGDLGFNPINTSIGKIGVLICWDQWFPEAARLMALAGADLLIYPTAIGWFLEDSKLERKKQLDAWITIQRSHAIANGIPVISVNRVGFEKNPNYKKGLKSKVNIKGIYFWGNSFICGPQGEIIAKANEKEEKIIIHDLDLDINENVRQIWPFLRDRRIEFYNNITKRYIE